MAVQTGKAAPQRAGGAPGASDRSLGASAVALGRRFLTLREGSVILIRVVVGV
jgi:hypothetical protein